MAKNHIAEVAKLGRVKIYSRIEQNLLEHRIFKSPKNSLTNEFMNKIF